MKIFRTPTGYVIEKEALSEYNLELLKAKMSTVDFNTQIPIPVAIKDVGRFIKIPRIPEHLIKKIAYPETEFIDVLAFPHKKLGFLLKGTPLPHQTKPINDILEAFTDGEPRVLLSLGAGLGKTFIAQYVINRLGVRFLVLVKNTKLLYQFYDSIKKFTNMTGIGVIDSSSRFEDIVENHHTALSGLIMTHRGVDAIIRKYGEDYFIKSIAKLGIGIKIMDETDLESKSMYNIDMSLAIRYNLYLTATPYKSMLPDDKVFQLVTRDVVKVGKDIKIENNKTCHVIFYKSTPTPKEYVKCYIRNMFNKVYYNEYAPLKHSLYDRLFKIFKDTAFKKIVYDNGKICFFVGRIDNCVTVRDMLIERFGIPEKDVGIVNSSISDAEKERNLKKPYIVSITNSLGRGFDDKDLHGIVLIEFFQSASEFTQVLNRIGRVGGTHGHMFYCVDQSHKRTFETYKNRISTIQKSFNKVNFHNYTGEDERSDSNKYLYGYCTDSPMAKNIKESVKKNTKMTNTSKRMIGNKIEHLLRSKK
ncbi:MAG: DEAD/DEAH box helicase [Paraclostridium sp.]